MFVSNLGKKGPGRTLRDMAQRSDGQFEALQVMGQIAEQQVQQLMKYGNSVGGYVQQAGLPGRGDPKAGSQRGSFRTGAIQDWFSKHRDCAVKVDTMCKPVREKPVGHWTHSTESRVCLAARNVAL
jgi:hypothetical protein